LGFAFSAAICAIASPADFCVNETLMPVSFRNALATPSHHGACTLQTILS
jgi:hypothetical protein